MGNKTSFLKENHLIVIGRRFGSDSVALEAAEAAARWSRDEAVLASYGFGATVRARFEEDRAKHEELRASRSQAVANKKNSYATRDQQVEQAWAWVDQVGSMLGVLGLTDAPGAVPESCLTSCLPPGRAPPGAVPESCLTSCLPPRARPPPGGSGARVSLDGARCQSLA
jgi:hypothetical protein